MVMVVVMLRLVIRSSNGSASDVGNSTVRVALVVAAARSSSGSGTGSRTRSYKTSYGLEYISHVINKYKIRER